MPTRKMNRIPGPVYAAAGAGDLAYEKLRALPERVAHLRGRVAELRPVVAESVSASRADLDRLREVARRNAATLVSGAQAAQDKAAAVYSELVVRGEQVVRTVRAERAATKPDAPTEEIVATEVPAGIAPVAQPGVPAAADDVETAASVKAETTKVDGVKPAAKRQRPSAK